MKYKIEIEITNIDVGDIYYSFDYKVKKNGEVVKAGYYKK